MSGTDKKAVTPKMSEHRLPHSATSVPTARRLAEEAAAPRIGDSRLDDFVLMVSEAVSNAVLHAPPMSDGRILLTFESNEEVVRGVVTGGGSMFVSNPEPAAEDQPRRHFGLKIIDELSNRWGVTVDGATYVWFEVDARRGSTTDADP
jgi:serine/threonine-protein kinase RsbW